MNSLCAAGSFSPLSVWISQRLMQLAAARPSALGDWQASPGLVRDCSGIKAVDARGRALRWLPQPPPTTITRRTRPRGVSLEDGPPSDTTMIVPAGCAPPCEGVNISDEMPRAIGSVPVSSVAELGRHLAYQPLADDFWIPMPTRPALARFLLEEPCRLDLRPTGDRRIAPEHHMAGLLHAIRLREYMVHELWDMSHESLWRDMLGLDSLSWYIRSQMITELLRRDVRDLHTQHLFHSFNVRRKHYSACLHQEVDQNWEWAWDAAVKRRGGGMGPGTLLSCERTAWSPSMDGVGPGPSVS